MCIRALYMKLGTLLIKLLFPTRCCIVPVMLSYRAQHHILLGRLNPDSCLYHHVVPGGFTKMVGWRGFSRNVGKWVTLHAFWVRLTWFSQHEDIDILTRASLFDLIDGVQVYWLNYLPSGCPFRALQRLQHRSCPNTVLLILKPQPTRADDVNHTLCCAENGQQS